MNIARLCSYIVAALNYTAVKWPTVGIKTMRFDIEAVVRISIN